MIDVLVFFDISIQVTIFCYFFPLLKQRRSMDGFGRTDGVILGFYSLGSMVFLFRVFIDLKVNWIQESRKLKDTYNQEIFPERTGEVGKKG